MDPRNTYDLGHSSKPSSWTCTCVPYVIRPTDAFSGSSDSACVRDCFSAPSSSSMRHTSTTNMYAGGDAAGLWSWYSMVV